LAAKNEIVFQPVQDAQPQKVVIVAGPSFGSAMKFLLLGAALGAFAVHTLSGKSNASATGDATLDAAGEATTKGAERLLDRLNALASRVKNLAKRARESARHASHTIGPALSEAIDEARITSHIEQEKLEADLHRQPGETVVLPETLSIATEQA